MPTQPENPPPGPVRHQSPQELVESLQRQIERLEAGRRPQEAAVVSSGSPPLDELLPEKGFRRGTLIEWLSEGEGTGVATLALLAARQACSSGGVLVVLDEHRQFYPPAAARLGMDLTQMIIVQAASVADNLWAMDQALRCPAAAAVLGWPRKLDGRTFRRMQLAAEQGGGLGLLLRPAGAEHEPSWAEIRLRVEPLPAASQGGRRLRIEVLRSRGQAGGASVEVEVDDETCTVCLAPRLASPTTRPRASGA
jgi:protein ImuA